MRNRLLILTAAIAVLTGTGCSSQKASNNAADAAAWKPAAKPPPGYMNIVAHSGPAASQAAPPAGSPPAPAAPTNP